MTSSTDGAGITSTYTFSPASEILSLTSSLSNSTNPPNIVSNVQYGPNGPINGSLGNGLSSVYHYDALGRLNGGWVCNGSNSASCSGGAQIYGFTNAWKQDQLNCSSDTVLNQGSNYGYDEFNRLISRTVNSGPVQNYTWQYDRYGNRWQQNFTAGTGNGSTSSLSFNTATNQINTGGYTYDAAGNVIYDTFHHYSYDAEGNIIAVDSGQTATYVYNALNQRVRTVVGGTATEYVFSAAGQRVSEWNGTTRAQLKGKYYWGGQPVAYYTTASSSAGAAAHFEHQDWLGTERLRTAYNGSVEGSYTSLPFGDGQATTGADTDASHYATLDHDTESDTEHAQFRQYSNQQGRFLSPDPYGGSYNAGNPQSFNRYVYAMNNPLSYRDPSGLDDGSCEDGTDDCGDPDNPDGGGGGGGGGDSSSGGIPNPTSYPPGSIIQDPNGTLWVVLADNTLALYVETGPSILDSLSTTPGVVSIPDAISGSSVPEGFYPSGQPNIAYENKVSSCFWGAAGNGALHIGIDAIGLIPEGGGTARVVGNVARYRGIVATQYGVKAIMQGKGAVGAISGAFGLGDTSPMGLASTGLTIAGFIPGLGSGTAVLSMALDAYKTGEAIAQCP